MILTMDPSYIWFALAAVLAVAIAFAILRMIVYFVRGIPKWVYVLVMFAAICGVAFIFFGRTIVQTFGY